MRRRRKKKRERSLVRARVGEAPASDSSGVRQEINQSTRCKQVDSSGRHEYRQMLSSAAAATRRREKSHFIHAFWCVIFALLAVLISASDFELENSNNVRNDTFESAKLAAEITIKANDVDDPNHRRLRLTPGSTTPGGRSRRQMPINIDEPQGDTSDQIGNSNADDETQGSTSEEPNSGQLVLLVFWYKDDNPAPIYTLDVRPAHNGPLIMEANALAKGGQELNVATKSSGADYTRDNEARRRHNETAAERKSSVGARMDALNRRLLAQAKHYTHLRGPPRLPAAATPPGAQKLSVSVGEWPLVKLRLENVTSDDSGTYKCRIDFRRAQTVRQSTRLIVRVPVSKLELGVSGQISIQETSVGAKRISSKKPTAGKAPKSIEKSARVEQQQVQRISLNQDERTELLCVAYDASPKPELIWLVRWPIFGSRESSHVAQTSPVIPSNSTELDQIVAYSPEQILPGLRPTSDSPLAMLNARIETLDHEDPKLSSSFLLSQEQPAPRAKSSIVAASRLTIDHLAKSMHLAHIGCRAMEQPPADGSKGGQAEYSELSGRAKRTNLQHDEQVLMIESHARDWPYKSTMRGNLSDISQSGAHNGHLIKAKSALLFAATNLNYPTDGQRKINSQFRADEVAAVDSGLLLRQMGGNSDSLSIQAPTSLGADLLEEGNQEAASQIGGTKRTAANHNMIESEAQAQDERWRLSQLPVKVTDVQEQTLCSPTSRRGCAGGSALPTLYPRARRMADQRSAAQRCRQGKSLSASETEPTDKTKWLELQLNLKPEKIEISFSGTKEKNGRGHVDGSQSDGPKLDSQTGNSNNNNNNSGAPYRLPLESALTSLVDLNESQSGGETFVCRSRGSLPAAKIRWAWRWPEKSGAAAKVPGAKSVAVSILRENNFDFFHVENVTTTIITTASDTNGRNVSLSESQIRFKRIPANFHRAKLICLATNQHFSPLHSDRSLLAQMELRVNFKPRVRIEELPQSDQRRSGKRQFKCLVMSNPPINQLVWLANGQAIGRVSRNQLFNQANHLDDAVDSDEQQQADAEFSAGQWQHGAGDRNEAETTSSEEDNGDERGDEAAGEYAAASFGPLAQDELRPTMTTNEMPKRKFDITVAEEIRKLLLLSKMVVLNTDAADIGNGAARVSEQRRSDLDLHLDSAPILIEPANGASEPEAAATTLAVAASEPRDNYNGPWRRKRRHLSAAPEQQPRLQPTAAIDHDSGSVLAGAAAAAAAVIRNGGVQPELAAHRHHIDGFTLIVDRQNESDDSSAPANADEPEYRCRATNALGESTSEPLRLIDHLQEAASGCLNIANIPVEPFGEYIHTNDIIKLPHKSLTCPIGPRPSQRRSSRAGSKQQKVAWSFVSLAQLVRVQQQSRALGNLRTIRRTSTSPTAPTTIRLTKQQQQQQQRSNDIFADPELFGGFSALIESDGVDLVDADRLLDSQQSQNGLILCKFTPLMANSSGGVSSQMDDDANRQPPCVIMATSQLQAKDGNMVAPSAAHCDIKRVLVHEMPRWESGQLSDKSGSSWWLTLDIDCSRVSNNRALIFQLALMKKLGKGGRRRRHSQEPQQHDLGFIPFEFVVANENQIGSRQNSNSVGAILLSSPERVVEAESSGGLDEKMLIWHSFVVPELDAPPTRVTIGNLFHLRADRQASSSSSRDGSNDGDALATPIASALSLVGANQTVRQSDGHQQWGQLDGRLAETNEQMKTPASGLQAASSYDRLMGGPSGGQAKDKQQPVERKRRASANGKGELHEANDESTAQEAAGASNVSRKRLERIVGELVFSMRASDLIQKGQPSAIYGRDLKIEWDLDGRPFHSSEDRVSSSQNSAQVSRSTSGGTSDLMMATSDTYSQNNGLFLVADARDNPEVESAGDTPAVGGTKKSQDRAGRQHSWAIASENPQGSVWTNKLMDWSRQHELGLTIFATGATVLLSTLTLTLILILWKSRRHYDHNSNQNNSSSTTTSIELDSAGSGNNRNHHCNGAISSRQAGSGGRSLTMHKMNCASPVALTFGANLEQDNEVGRLHSCGRRNISTYSNTSSSSSPMPTSLACVGTMNHFNHFIRIVESDCEQEALIECAHEPNDSSNNANNQHQHINNNLHSCSDAEAATNLLPRGGSAAATIIRSDSQLRLGQTSGVDFLAPPVTRRMNEITLLY